MHRANTFAQRVKTRGQEIAWLICWSTIPVFAGINGPEHPIQIIETRVENYQSANGMTSITLQMKNLTAQVITAWSLRVNQRYANGTSESSDWRVDSVSSLFPGREVQGWQPGAIRSEKVSVLRAASKEVPVAVDVEVRMAAMEDGTAVGDAREIRMLGAVRKAIAESQERTIATIERALRAPSPVDEMRKALAGRNEGAGMQSLDSMQQVYMMLEKGSSPERLAEFVGRLRAYHALLKKHAAVTRKE